MKFIKSKYQWRINENLLHAKKILKDNNIPETDELFLSLKKELKDNLGYMGWFTKMLVVNKISKSEINDIIAIIKNDKYIIDNLPIDLIKYIEWEKLIDDIISVKFNRNVKKIINELTTTIKNTMPKNISNNHKLMFNDIFKHKEKENFIRKISRYQDYKSFISALEIFLNSTTNSYNDILDNIERCGAKLIHSNKSEDIIICQVNYTQLKRLGGDTSWCIVPSKNTFNSYVKDGSKQYIIFLTDINNNYSKIGATIGFKLTHAHLKDDKSISENSLEKLLSKRKYKLKSLYQTKESFLKDNDINVINVNFLIHTVGLSKKFILDNKKAYIDSDLYFFTDSEKKEYNLNRNLKIKSLHDLKKEFPELTASDFIENEHRFMFKIDMHELLSINPSPRQLDLITVLHKDTIDELNLIKKYVNKPIELLENLWRFNKCKSIYKRYDDEYEIRDVKNINFIIYALKYCNIYPNIIDNDDLLKINLPSDLYISNVIGVFKHLELNGFVLDEKQLVKAFSRYVRGSMMTSDIQNWLKVLEKFPIIRDSILPNVENSIGKNYFYDSELKVIKQYYPELYDDIRESSNIIKQYEDFSRIKPYSNYMDSDTFIKFTLRKENVTFNEYLESIYSKYFGDGLLKKYKFTNKKEICFIIVILLKLNRISELKDFSNIIWLGYDSGLDYVIRMSFDMVEVFGSPELKLSELEKENLYTTLMSMDFKNMKDIDKYCSFSLIYYLKSWGFNNYIKIVEKQTIRSVTQLGDEGKYIKEENELRMRFMKHILSYLIKKGRHNECKEVVDIVMSWDMGKEERKKSLEYICNSYELDIRGEVKDLWVNYISRYYKL